jgi:DNA mismatch repair protein MutS
MEKELLLDLGILSAISSEDALLKKFDFTHTEGGKKKIKEFLCPNKFDFTYIAQQQESLKAICRNNNKWHITWDNQDIYYIKEYLDSNRVVTSLDGNKLKNKAKSIYTANFKKDSYLFAERGVKLVLIFFNKLLIAGNSTTELPQKLAKPITEINAFITINRLAYYYHKDRDTALSSSDVLLLDNVFRNTGKLTFEALLNHLFEIEAFISLAKACLRYNLHFPVVNKSDNLFNIKGLFHPLVNNCERNDIKITENQTVVFLTGPNMSGKSTFLKSLGLCIYLSHIGMAVPAEDAVIPFFDEIHTSINSTDSAAGGYSHFKAELNKVKEVALDINAGKNVFVIIDEIFKGTNLQDAYDCSKEVISLLSSHKGKFIISSHITELHNDLKQYNSINFKCFDGFMHQNEPSFNYKLSEGVSSMRLGYYLLRQEGIVNLLKENKSLEYSADKN